MAHNEGEIQPSRPMAKLQVELPDELKMWLKLTSVQQGQTMSEITQEALELWRQQQQAKGGSNG